MKEILVQILKAKSKRGLPFETTVTGVSMQPVLQAGDLLMVQPCDNYLPGEICVFLYKQGELLVHRLLKVERERYYLKGDNAFRLEDVDADQILGKVIQITRGGKCWTPPPCSAEQIENSLDVNRAFVHCRYDVEKTMESLIYQAYRSNYLVEGTPEKSRGS